MPGDVRDLKLKYSLYLIASLMVLGGGIGALLYYVLPEYYPQWYGAILLVVFVMELTVINLVGNASKRLSGQKLANLYMAVKGGKLLLSFLFVGAYMLSVKEGIKSFVLIYLLFYMFYVFLEVPFFAEIERRIKNIEG